MKREIKIGIIMILGVGMLVYGLFFLKGIDLFKEQRVYYAVYDKIGGLTVSSPVKVNGLQVGQVTAIETVQDTSLHLRVEMVIQLEELNIPADSEAIIENDFLGTGSINLKLGRQYDNLAENGHTFRSDISKDIAEQVSDQMAPLKAKIEGLISQIDTAVQVVQVILNPKTQKNLNESFESIRVALLNMERTSFRLDTLVASEKNKIAAITSNIASISTNINNNEEKFNNIIDNFSTISDSLAQADIVGTINSAKTTLEDVSEIMDKINNGEGTAGLLINNDSLYNNLVSTSESLDALMQEFEAHPERFVHFSLFGRKAKPEFKKDEVKKLKDMIDN